MKIYPLLKSLNLGNDSSNISNNPIFDLTKVIRVPNVSLVKDEESE